MSRKISPKISALCIAIRPTALALARSGAILTLLATPFWRRMPYAVGTYHPLYGLGFFITLPILLTITAWAASGFAGLDRVLCDPLRRIGVLALWALAGWMWLSVRWSFMAGHDQPNVAQSAALQFSLIAGWATAVASISLSPRLAAAALVATASVSGGVAILQAHQQSTLGLEFFGEFAASPDWAGANVLMAGGVRWLRPAGFLPHPNTLAGALLPGLLATAAFLQAPSRRVRSVGLGALALILWGFLLTFSRAGFLGFAAGGFALVPLLRTALGQAARRRGLIVGLVLVLVIGGAFGGSYRALLTARTGGGSENTEMRSIADRLVFSLFAYRALTEARQNLVFGIGAGNFPWRSSYYLAETDYDLRGNNVHHLFLSALVETGLVGYGLFVLATFSLFEAGLRQQRRGSRAADVTAQAGFLAAVVGFGVIGLFDHYPWTMIQFQALWWGLLNLASSPKA